MGCSSHDGSKSSVTKSRVLMPPRPPCAKPTLAHSCSQPPASRAASNAGMVRPTRTVPAILPRKEASTSVPAPRRAAISAWTSADSSAPPHELALSRTPSSLPSQPASCEVGRTSSVLKPCRTIGPSSLVQLRHVSVTTSAAERVERSDAPISEAAWGRRTGGPAQAGGAGARLEDTVLPGEAAPGASRFLPSPPALPTPSPTFPGTRPADAGMRPWPAATKDGSARCSARPG